MKKKRVKLTVLLAVVFVGIGMFYTKADDLLRAEQVRTDTVKTENGAAYAPVEDASSAPVEKTEEADADPNAMGEPGSSGLEAVGQGSDSSEESSDADGDTVGVESVYSDNDTDEKSIEQQENVWNTGSLGSSLANESEKTSVSAEKKVGTVGYILIGDSRFVGMNMAVDVGSDENRFLIAKNGAGYDFLVNTALPQAARIEKQHPRIESWTYIINLGVNDLQYAWKYSMTYRELLKSKNLVIESVNPMDYSVSPPSSQKDIEAFNERMKMIEGVAYLDTYQLLMKNGFSTTDGVHYTAETYSYIYKCIEEYIRKSEEP